MDIRKFFGGGSAVASSQKVIANPSEKPSKVGSPLKKTVPPRKVSSSKTTVSPSKTSNIKEFSSKSSSQVLTKPKENIDAKLSKEVLTNSKNNDASKQDLVLKEIVCKDSLSPRRPDHTQVKVREQPKVTSKEDKQGVKRTSSVKQIASSSKRIKDDFINDSSENDDDEDVIAASDEEDAFVTRSKRSDISVKSKKAAEVSDLKKRANMSDIFSDEAEDIVPGTEEKQSKRNRKETNRSSKAKKKNGNKEVNNNSNQDESSQDDIATKKKKINNRTSGDTVKRKKEFISSSSEEASDEDIIHATKKKPRSKKKQTSRNAIKYDSGSEEDPLPKELRQASRKHGKNHFTNLDPRSSIEQAFQKVTEKHPTLGLDKPGPSTLDPKRIAVNPADFFGTAPVQRIESRHIPHADESRISTDASRDNDNEIKSSSLSGKLSQKMSNAELPNSKHETHVMDHSKTVTSTAVMSLSEQIDKKPAVESHKTSPTSSRQTVSQTKQTSPQSKTPVGKKAGSHSENASSVEKGALHHKNSAAAYMAFKNREPPKSLGSKQLPEGAENCLEGITFVITGVLESFERDEIKNVIERLGGKITTNVSKNTKYLLAGRDAGESKLAKAAQFGTTRLDEDGLIELILSLPGKKSKYEIAAEKEASSAKTPGKSPFVRKLSDSTSLCTTPKSAPSAASITTPKRTSPISSCSASKSVISLDNTATFAMSAAATCNKTPVVEPSSTAFKLCTPAASTSRQSTPCLGQMSQASTSSQLTESPDIGECAQRAVEGTLMWVDKYKPTSLRQIIGQQGDKSNAKKLVNWIISWHKNIGRKPIFGRANDDGAGYKAALLSGPPGVGKTTTAQLICKETGFSFVELNASDTRSKRSLQEDVMEALNNHTLVDYFGPGKSSGTVDGRKHCLIMDEVDGMAGNEDRGGMQELIQLIKHTKIPVICMCNDRNHPKIRSLSNHCFDLRFQRPRVEQIKGAMMSLAFKEGLKVPPAAMNDIISAANQDIRQVIHNLSMWTVKDKSLTYEQLKADAKNAEKDLHFGPFDVCRKVFAGGEETAHMSINDKSELFFHDYSIGPLFVQENYLSVTPYAAKGRVSEHLRCMSRAADSIAAGDVFDGAVRRGGNWTLLPTQAIFASVIPGEAMRGSIGGMIQFPSWLGKNSTTNKNDRLLQELGTHMRLNISGNKRSLNLEYLPVLKKALTTPLVQNGVDGVSQVVQLMNDYDLLREDLDSINELSAWTGVKDEFTQLDSKVKAAFTRAYNKEVHLTPYATGAAPKKGARRGAVAADDEDMELMDGYLGGDGEENGSKQEDEQSGDDEEDLTKDTMIKMKKPAAATKAKNKSESSQQDKSQGSSQSKAKGKAPAKGAAIKKGKYK